MELPCYSSYELKLQFGIFRFSFNSSVHFENFDMYDSLLRGRDIFMETVTIYGFDGNFIVFHTKGEPERLHFMRQLLVPMST